MTFRTIPVELVQVPTLASDTINEIKERRPLYVFMERAFLQDSLPPSYPETRERILAIIAYVRAHYQPYMQGKYLIVMKTKS